MLTLLHLTMHYFLKYIKRNIIWNVFITNITVQMNSKIMLFAQFPVAICRHVRVWLYSTLSVLQEFGGKRQFNWQNSCCDSVVRKLQKLCYVYYSTAWSPSPVEDGIQTSLTLSTAGPFLRRICRRRQTKYTCSIISFQLEFLLALLTTPFCNYDITD